MMCARSTAPRGFFGKYCLIPTTLFGVAVRRSLWHDRSKTLPPLSASLTPPGLTSSPRLPSRTAPFSCYVHYLPEVHPIGPSLCFGGVSSGDRPPPRVPAAGRFWARLPSDGGDRPGSRFRFKTRPRHRHVRPSSSSYRARSTRDPHSVRRRPGPPPMRIPPRGRNAEDRRPVALGAW
jgi:hypothetical protein